MGTDDKTPRPFRRSMLPPAPPGDLYTRIALIERDQHHRDEKIDHMAEEVDELVTKFGAMSTNLDKVLEDRAEFKKSRDRWKNWWLGISSSLAVALIIALFTIAWRVQSNRLLP